MEGKVIDLIDSVDLVEVYLSPRYAFLRLVPLPDPEADDSKPEAKAESKAGGYTEPISIDPDAEPATKAGRYPGAYPVYCIDSYSIAYIDHPVSFTMWGGHPTVSKRSACPIYTVLRRRHTLLWGHPVFNSSSSTTPNRELNYSSSTCNFYP